MKKVSNPIKFDSDDTEGSDLSYESSFDEKEDNQGLNILIRNQKVINYGLTLSHLWNSKLAYLNESNHFIFRLMLLIFIKIEEQKNINLFKEQMVRFLLTHPELQDDIKFSKDIINAQAETPVAQAKNDMYMGGTMGGTIGGMGYNSGSAMRPQTAMASPADTNQIQDKKGYRNTMWESIANNIMQETKRTGTMPSIENFSQRLNLFRKKIEKPDVIEIILQNKDTLLKQIKKEEERKAKIQNRIHETIEAKLRKEQGDVKYYSKLKKNQFDSRMQKEEARVRQNKQINNNTNSNNQNTNSNTNQMNFNNAPNIVITQNGMQDKSPDKRNSVPFNMMQYGQSNYPQTPQQGPVPSSFQSPQQQKYMMQQSGSLQIIGGSNQQQNQQFLLSDGQDKKLKQQKSIILNQQNQINPQTLSVSRIVPQNTNNPNISYNQNNISGMGMQAGANNQSNQKNQKNLRFQTPPTNPPPQQQQYRQELENRIINSNNPVIKDNLSLNMRIQLENQKQFKTFKARPVPGVFERLSQDQVKKNQQTEVEIDIPLDIEFKTAKGEQLYREIRKKDDEEEIKRHVIKFLLEHRQKAEDEFKLKPSLLSQGQKYYSEESKEFSLLSPNFMAKKKMQELIEKGTITDDFFEHRANLEEGNVYLLTKVSKILKGNIMKKWKSIQDSKF